MDHPVVIPDLRRTIRHALPNVVEGKVVPVLLFVAFLNVIGNIPALLVTLAWSTGSLGYRWLTGRRIPGLIILGAVVGSILISLYLPIFKIFDLVRA